MLEAGSVRTKNASVICLKNLGLYSIAGLAYYVIGYNLMYTDVGQILGTVDLGVGSTADEVALLNAGDDAKAAATQAVVAGDSYSSMSNWFFQMVFVATAASIVSGTLAERVKLWTFFVFVAILTAIIYPVVGAWTWGGGWLGGTLEEWTGAAFKDFAGSTIVHSTGGWAALAGALVVGPRIGKFRADGSVKPTPRSNIPAVTLGVFILWLGWFGFNGGSQLALASALDAVAMSNVLVNTNLAAGAGVIAAVSVSRSILGRVDLLAVLNGAIAGLVSITAGPDFVEHYWAIVIGAVGGVVVVAGIKFLEVLRLDDVVGAVPAHLFAGVWGTLAVCIASGGNFMAQLIGVVGDRRVRFRRVFAGVVRAGQTHRRARDGAGGRARSGRLRARHRGVSGVRRDAGPRRRRGVSPSAASGGGLGAAAAPLGAAAPCARTRARPWRLATCACRWWMSRPRAASSSATACARCLRGRTSPSWNCAAART